MTGVCGRLFRDSRFSSSNSFLTSTIMSSNPHRPHAQKPLRSEDDVFGATPMQVDDPADNNGNPSTPTRPTPPSTQSTICISEQTIQYMCKYLERSIRTSDDDDWIRQSLDFVWVAVRDALQEDPNLKARLANENQFKETSRKKTSNSLSTY